MTYRARALLRLVPPLAYGGHAFSVLEPEERELPATLLDPPASPGWLRCGACFVTLEWWRLAEGYYPRPCRALLRALPAGAA